NTLCCPSYGFKTELVTLECSKPSECPNSCKATVSKSMLSHSSSPFRVHTSSSSKCISPARSPINGGGQAACANRTPPPCTGQLLPSKFRKSPWSPVCHDIRISASAALQASRKSILVTADHVSMAFYMAHCS